ncbi:hypothetical protein F5X99DRAFT_158765 [Biscogniauxia marginata]|nr:hypothetical protein F5X99DRAFT_158765 [Biscogniauxia marginata]
MNMSSPLGPIHAAPGSAAWAKMCTSSKLRSPINVRNQPLLAQLDYFSDQLTRGSSPSSTLAVDLSQNFRLDNEVSPLFATPRRALFTKGDGHRGDMANDKYVLTTPRRPTGSSPMYMDDDAMDISPLPPKPGFSTSIEITSPTPMQSPGDEMMLATPVQSSRQGAGSLDPSNLFHDGRKRVGLRRPSLTRTKGYTTSSLLTRGDAQVRASAMSPGECFEGSSPPQQQSAATPLTLRSKTQFASLGGARDYRTGSPIAAHTRRPSIPPARSRRQCIRSLSMFDDTVVKDQAEAEEPISPYSQETVAKIEESQKLMLPHCYPIGCNDNLPRISGETFLDLLNGKFNGQYTQKIVIDCRFEYEYEGGHIDGAVNYNDKDLLLKHLFDVPMEGKTLLIFHCEFSLHRAPLMARHVRSEDRAVNAENYPKLTYPEVYILQGGYSNFFNQHRDRCSPPEYVDMHDIRHISTCERELDKLQLKQKSRKGLNRAQTYAFGTRDSLVAESPPAIGRDVEHQSPVRMIGNSPILGKNRSPARRMASY